VSLGYAALLRRSRAAALAPAGPGGTGPGARPTPEGAR
jgi:hypothetical protein